ncbi:hypothetical protein CTEN210_01342 [Chaetoceros tenuissimus]|uniref:Uncharacterized protein n=1 Tax=Chaetoceros tenuissimus TaxID=426638 RepID=A0AAD3GZT2_9STRA|nr:hypothetical protein CTEN210_01342 [Chaetoceros tenuissimus]
MNVSSSIRLLCCCSGVYSTFAFSVSNRYQHRSKGLSATSPFIDKKEIIWSPTDLTKDNEGFEPIPADDYIKKYQAHPELWPVELFVIPYRRVKKDPKDTENDSKVFETQILVRESANGTSKYGLGTGVPVKRWLLSSQESSPPKGYKVRQPRLTFDACNFPEFPKDCENWTYSKIDIKKDAFQIEHEFKDQELESFAKEIRKELKRDLTKRIANESGCTNNFEYETLVLINNILQNENCIAAIQGTFRMSGLFAKNENGSRHISFNAVDTHKILDSMRVYTMFPQMPDPLPLPCTSAEDLRKEIDSRKETMKKTGRNMHQDKYGRIYTHISTSNVSNTIHGVYFPVDCSELPNIDKIPAYNLFGTKAIEKEWVSLRNLGILENAETICTRDAKSTFISSAIVRQLVRDGVIET